MRPFRTKTASNAVSAAVAVAAFGLICAPAFAAGIAGPKPAAASGYQTFRDPQKGFSLERPAGWAVRADDHTIVVQSPDQTQTMLAELFAAGNEESAEAYLRKLPQRRAGLFPGARLTNLKPAGASGDISGTLSYQTQNGPGAGRVLCSVVNGKGMLYVLSAPAKIFPAKQATLVHVVRSLRFGLPKANAASGGKASMEAQVKAAQKSMKFVTWADPREHAFTIQTPKGWKMEGGTFRGEGVGIARQTYEATSPDESISIVAYDPRVPVSFMAPSQLTAQVGMAEGTANILHYMPATEFNHWYLERLLSEQMENIQVQKDQSLPAASRRQTQAMRQLMGALGDIDVNVGLTEFSGQSRETGKKITGVVISSTQRTISNGVNGVTTSWFGLPCVIACVDVPGQTKNQITAMAAFLRMQQSFQMDLNWQKQRTAELGAITRGTIASAKQRSEMLAQQNKAQSDALMDSYWARDRASDENQRHFINYIADKTDVTDNAGFAAKVTTGSNHYYRSTRTGTVIGTNSEITPGIDFTPLSEY